MTDDHTRACSRCGRGLDHTHPPSLSYREGPVRHLVCVGCLTWEEKDAFLSVAPVPAPAPAERTGRFSRPAAAPAAA